MLEPPSAPTAASLDSAAHALGMFPINLPADDLRLGDGGPSRDAMRVLSCYAAAVVVRAGDHDVVARLARASTVPVINARTDEHHPSQAIADLVTLREHFGRLDGLVVAYVGLGGDVAHSLMEAGALAGMHVRVACPPDHPPDLAVRVGAETTAERHGGSVTVTNEPARAVAGAHAVYATPWRRVSGERPAHPRRLYRVDPALMRRARSRAVFMHPLPAEQGEEVAPGMVDGPSSIVWDQASNRVPAQQAVIHALATTAGAVGAPERATVEAS